MTITADDIQIEAVEALAIESIEWDATTVTITFNREVTLTDTGSLGLVELTGESWNGSAVKGGTGAENTIIYTIDTGDVLNGNDTLSVINGGGSRCIEDDYGYQIASGTITLNADHTGNYTAN